jgi:hypothetical protein
MASLFMVIDKQREAVYALVDLTIRLQMCKVSANLDHCSEKGWHVTIRGEKTDLEKLKAAFEKKGEIANIYE